MSITINREAARTLMFSAVLIVLGAASFWANQVQYADRRAHSDARWADIDKHITASCGPKR